MGSSPRIAALLVLLSGCATAPPLESDRPIQNSPEPKVNTGNEVRYWTRMSEERGVRALRRLAETADSEEIWVYIPKKKEWWELGVNEGNDIIDENDPRYRKRSVDVDGQFLNVLAGQFHSFTIYHTHNVKKRVVSETVFYNPECSLPSYEDLCTDVKILNFFAQARPGHSIRFKSVSLLGVTEVTFSEEARARYEELLSAREEVRLELVRLEDFNFLKPFQASVFKDRIRIQYTPLVTPK